MKPALEDWQQLNACRRGLVSSFLRHYRAAGYREAAPLSVTSKQDESVVFVGAAIFWILDIVFLLLKGKVLEL